MSFAPSSRQQFYYQGKAPVQKHATVTPPARLLPRPPPTAQNSTAYAANYFRQRRSDSTARERREPVSVSTSEDSQSSTSSSAIKVAAGSCLLQTPPVFLPQVDSNRSIQHIPPFEDEDDETTDKELERIAASSSVPTGSSSEDTEDDATSSSIMHPSSSSVCSSRSQLQSALSDMTPEDSNHKMVLLFQQLQQRHEQDRANWKIALRAAEDKKAQYKLELRHTIANQLEWLEDRLRTTPSETNSTTGPSKTKVLQELLTLTDQQHAHDQQTWQTQEQQLQDRIQHLESLVEQWKKASQTSTTPNEESKTDDTNTVLEQERQQWAAERETLQAQLEEANRENDERDALQEELVTEFEAARKECLEQKLRIDDLTSQLSSTQQELENVEEQLNAAQLEVQTFRTQAADFSEAATTAKSQCTVLQKSLVEASQHHSTENSSPSLFRPPPSPKILQHRVEWEDKLDRAVAERDMFRQEAEQLRQQLQQQNNITTLQNNPEYDAIVEQHDVLKRDLEALKTNYVEEQAAWKKELNAATEASQKLESDMAAANIKHLKELDEMKASKIKIEASLRNQFGSEKDSWQQQLNAAKENVQKLEDALANEADRHAKEVRELKSQILQLESQAKLRRNQQHEMEQRLTNEKSASEAQLEEKSRMWKSASEEKDKEMDRKCRNLLEKHRAEVRELAAHLEKLAKENESQPIALQRLTDMAEQHTKEKREWSDKLDSTSGENARLKVEVQQLSQVLADLKTLHTNTMANYQTVMNEKENLQIELERLKRNENALMDQEALAKEETARNQTELLLRGIDELRRDFRQLQDKVSSTQMEKNVDIVSCLNGFREDLINIQNSLNDAVAELTLEADAMLESREAIKSVASDASSSLEHHKEISKSSHFQEQQETLLMEVLNLKHNLDMALVRPRAEKSMSDEAMLDLRRAEVEVAVARTELTHCQEKLEAEIASRQRAEAEVGALSEQADAYEEQLMTLQSLNDTLTKKLHIAGLKIDASLVEMPTHEDILSTLASPKPDPSAKSPSTRSEDLSVPFLDEALAMAENLNHIVNDGDKKTSLLEMLESMSDMIDAQGHKIARSPPVFSPPTSPSSCPGRRPSHSFDSPGVRSKRYSSISPMERHRKFYDECTGNIEVVHEVNSEDCDEKTPMPVETPVHPAPNSTVRTLQSIVEQLYTRCQLLERERAEMMEMSVELLESAKEANEAELDAALATARRKASEDLLRMRRETFGSQERVMKKLMKNPR